MTFILNILTIDNSFNFLIFLAVIAAKATFLIGFAALICLIFRRFSAAVRHLVWASVLCASLLLPLLSFVKGWEISILPLPVAALNNQSANENNEVLESQKTQISERGTSKVNSYETKVQINDLRSKKDTKFFSEPLLFPNPSELQTSPVQKIAPEFLPQLFNLILGFWFAGAFLFLIRLLTGIISTNWLSRQTVEFNNNDLNELFSVLRTELNLKNNIRLLCSERTLMPIVCGIWHPVVILPAVAETWAKDRCRVVLLHELTHIARRDCLTQILGQLACIFYWFNPFIWLAAHRLRVEREQACDEFVLSIGTKPSDYAHHLLEIARSIQTNEAAVFEWSPKTTIAMAQQSQLEERLRAILNPQGKNRRVSSLATVSLMLLIGILFISLVIIHPTAVNANSSSNVEAEISSKAKEITAEKNSFLDLFSKNDSHHQDKIPSEFTEKNESNPDFDKTLEKQSENIVQNGQRIEPNNLSDNEQNSKQNITQIEKAESTPEPSPIVSPNPNIVVNPNPNPFVNVEYKAENQSTQTQQKSDDFIEEMASVGYKNLSIDELINLKSVGVNADYVKNLRTLGFDNLTVRELVNMRAVGVTPKYIEEIRNAGFKDVTVKELSNLRALGVTSAFMATFRNAGYDNLSIKNLVDLKASGITLDFINNINSMGFGKLSLKELTNLKFISVTPDFIRLARSRLGDDLTLKQIIGLKNSGILRDKDRDRDKNKDKENQ